MKTKENHVAESYYNSYCVESFNVAMAEYFNTRKAISINRLYHCTAEIYETENYILLKSYSTFIAAFYKKTCTLFDVLRHEYGFTATSNQHICKFYKYLVNIYGNDILFYRYK